MNTVVAQVSKPVVSQGFQPADAPKDLSRAGGRGAADWKSAIQRSAAKPQPKSSSSSSFVLDFLPCDYEDEDDDEDEKICAAGENSERFTMIKRALTLLMRDRRAFWWNTKAKVAHWGCSLFVKTGFQAQGKMDIDRRSWWHNPAFVARYGGYFVPGDAVNRRLSSLEPWDTVRRDMILLLLRVSGRTRGRRGSGGTRRLQGQHRAVNSPLSAGAAVLFVRYVLRV